MVGISHLHVPPSARNHRGAHVGTHPEDQLDERAAEAGFSPDVITLTYEWYRGSVAIGGATSSTYQLKSKDKGQKIRARIYGAVTNYTTGSILTAGVIVKK
jgi:hypothetical protein